MVIDGCGTFFRRDRFSIIKKYDVEFNKAALSLSEALNATSQKKAALNRLLKDNVALIVVLEALDPPDPAAAPAGPYPPQGAGKDRCQRQHSHAGVWGLQQRAW